MAVEQRNYSLETYHGNPIFNNQPSYTFFNKSFENATDGLFLGLNEIHPLYMKEKQQQKDQEIFNSFNVLQDPRTKEKIEQNFYNHTDKYKPKAFDNTEKSTLTAAQHIACLRVLHAWQTCTNVNEEDLLVWRQTEGKRHTEKQNVQKLAFQYAQVHKEQMYAYVKMHMDLYKRWYALQLDQLKRSYPNDVAYNTHTGLPHVRICKCSDENYKVSIENVRIVDRDGWLPLFPAIDQLPRNVKNTAKLHHQLEMYCGIYNNDLPSIQTASNLKSDVCEKTVDDDDDGDKSDTDVEHLGDVIAPLESLILLLTAGDCLDIPSEVHLNIEASDNVCDNDSEQLKILCFAEPLPSRQCGWHTHNLIVHQAHQANLSTINGLQWFKLKKGIATLEEPKEVKEIAAGLCSDETTKSVFKPMHFEDYLTSNSNFPTNKEQEIKRCVDYVQWQLRSTSNSGIRTINVRHKTTGTAAAYTNDGKSIIATQCIKLEYKPQFGCEIMSKYELIREWLHIRLSPDNGNKTGLDSRGQCLRISAKNGELQLIEMYSLTKLEQQLTEIYHLNINQLMANLMEFLRLLLRMPIGNYLLRYNPKFRDKMMLCAPTKEFTSNTIHLHEFIQIEPNDLAFMTQQHFLPIADDLCSIVHKKNKILPCAFRPHSKLQLLHQRKQPMKQERTTLVTNKQVNILNDRDKLLQKIQEQKKKKQRGYSSTFIRKTARVKKAPIVNVKKEQTDLKIEIAIDEMLFGL